MGVNHEETYSPTCRNSTVLFIFTLTAYLDREIKQCDVTAAYLHARMDMPVYMLPPKGFCATDKSVWTKEYICGPNQCLRLDGAVYGTKQAGRQWYKYIHRILTIVLGYTMSPVDRRLLMIVLDDKTVNFLVIYVDDIIITGTSKAECERVLLILGQHFKLSIPNLEKFLRYETKRDHTKRLLYLTMSEYTKSIIKYMNMDDDEKFRVRKIP